MIMKKSVFIIFFTSLLVPASRADDRLLSGTYSLDVLKKVIIPISEFRPFPPASDKFGQSCLEIVYDVRCSGRAPFCLPSANRPLDAAGACSS